MWSKFGTNNISSSTPLCLSDMIAVNIINAKVVFNTDDKYSIRHFQINIANNTDYLPQLKIDNHLSQFNENWQDQWKDLSITKSRIRFDGFLNISGIHSGDHATLKKTFMIELRLNLAILKIKKMIHLKF